MSCEAMLEVCNPGPMLIRLRSSRSTRIVIKSWMETVSRMSLLLMPIQKHTQKIVPMTAPK